MLDPHPIPESWAGLAGLLDECFLPGAGKLFFSGEPISKVCANEPTDTPRPTTAAKQARTARFALKSLTCCFNRPAKKVQRPAAIRCENKELRLAHGFSNTLLPKNGEPTSLRSFGIPEGAHAI